MRIHRTALAAATVAVTTALVAVGAAPAFADFATVVDKAGDQKAKGVPSWQRFDVASVRLDVSPTHLSTSIRFSKYPSDRKPSFASVQVQATYDDTFVIEWKRNSKPKLYAVGDTGTYLCSGTTSVTKGNGLTSLSFRFAKGCFGNGEQSFKIDGGFARWKSGSKYVIDEFGATSGWTGSLG